MALGWIDLAITAVTTGISIFQGLKAKKKQEAAIKKAQEEAHRKATAAYIKQLDTNREQLMDILLQQKNEDALEAKKQNIIKILSFASAGISAFILIRKLSKNKSKKK